MRGNERGAGGNSWGMSETRQKGQRGGGGEHRERLLAWSLEYTSSMPAHETSGLTLKSAGHRLYIMETLTQPSGKYLQM